MEQFYKDARTPLRMRQGSLGEYVDEFARQLSEDGYARSSARYALQLAADLGRWMVRRNDRSAATDAGAPRALPAVPLSSSTLQGG